MIAQSGSSEVEQVSGGRDFVKNMGQWSGPASYGLELGRMNVWFLDDQVVYDISGPNGAGHVLRWSVKEGGRTEPSGLEGTRSFRSWHIDRGIFEDVPSYREIRYAEIRPGVDLRFRLNEGRLKYDLFLAPWTDPGSVRMEYEGEESIRLGEEGSLRVGTSLGELVEEAPVAYQLINGRRISVPVRFTLQGDGIGFEVGTYDRSRELVIDPTVRLGSYIGGNGPDEGRGTTVDSTGNVYVVGTTKSFDFPTTTGAIRHQLDSVNGSFDIFVSKFDPTMRRLIWSTYLGGSGADDPTGGIRLQRDGTVLIAGTTLSQNISTSPGVVGPVPSGRSDGFVYALRQSPDGSTVSRDWFTYLGGSEHDTITGIGVTGFGEIILTGTTYSFNFPIPGNGLWPNMLGTSDAFVYKLSGDARTRLGATFLGGDGAERGTGLAVDGRDRPLVIGTTFSDNFPRTQNATFAARTGQGDGFLVRLSADFSSLEFGTYFGGTFQETPTGVAVDRQRRAYVTGVTTSGITGDFPVTTGSSGPGGWFVSKFNPDNGDLLFSRLVTGESGDRGSGIAVDTNGRVYLSGTTTSSSFTIINGSEASTRGATDLAFVQLSPDGILIEQASVTGGGGHDVPAPQVWLSRFGDLYVTGRTGSDDLPVGRFPYDGTLNTTPSAGETDAFLLAWTFPPRGNIVGPGIRKLDTLFCENFVLDTFYVYNDGDAPLTILSNLLLDDQNTNFTLEIPEARLPNIRLEPGDSTMYVIRYETSGVNESETNQLLIGTTDSLIGKNPFVVTLQGSRYAPSVNPSPVAFGSIPICRDTVMEVTLINDGVKSVTFERPEFTLPDSPFRLEPGAVFPRTIPNEGGVSRFKVRFSPDVAGAYDDTLKIRIRECPDLVLTTILIGAAQSVVLEGVPDSVIFDDLGTCDPFRDEVLTLRNTGTSRLYLTESTLTGNGFSLIFQTTLPDTLDPGEERKVVARFSGSTMGSYSGEATISIAPCDTTFTIGFRGSRGEGALPTVSSDTLDFGTVSACKGSIVRGGPMQLTVTNTSGSEPLTLETPSLTLPFLSCDISNPAGVIAPGGSAVFRVCFDPLTEGSHQGVMKIGYEIGGCRDTFEIVLQGKREHPTIEPANLLIDIPPLSACESSHDTTLIVRNPSSTDVTVDSVIPTRGIELPDALFPIVIPAGDSIELTVRFAPVSSGVSSERLRFYFSPCSDSVDVIVNGSTQGIVATTNTDILDFGTMLLCDPPVERLRSVSVSWTGTTANTVSINTARIVGTDSEFSLVDPTSVIGAEIQEGESVDIELGFAPVDSGIVGDTLEIVIAPCMDTLRVVLRGEAVSPEFPISGGAFGNVIVSTRKPGSVTLSNDSHIPLVLDTIYAAGNPFDLDLSGISLPMTIGADNVVVIPVGFMPTEAGEVIDSIVVVFRGECDYRRTVVLSGTGVRSEVEAELCIRGLYNAPRFVGDTVTIRTESDRDVALDSPVDLLLTISFDPERFSVAEVDGGSVRDVDERTGTIEILAPNVSRIPEDLPKLRLRLLAGQLPFATVNLESVALLAGGGFAPAICDTVAIVSIADRCFVSGVTLGKFPNRLDRPVPNPVDDVVEISFQQLEDAPTTLRLWNADGREVLRPLDSFLPGGRYSVTFGVEDLPPGMYFYGVRAGTWFDVGTLIINR